MVVEEGFAANSNHSESTVRQIGLLFNVVIWISVKAVICICRQLPTLLISPLGMTRYLAIPDFVCALAVLEAYWYFLSRSVLGLVIQNKTVTIYRN